MWRIEDVLSELNEQEEGKNEKGGIMAPGFRFHPTDEELISFYLASKVFNTTPTTYFSALFLHIPQVDLNRCEPWDLPESAKMGEREWYFYSLRDRKYPTGLRTNRATLTGYWKATGKDRHVYATTITTATVRGGGGGGGIGGGGSVLIGMKKTLVFYQGRAPRGVKTPWVMHEYRLDGHFSSSSSSSLSSNKEEWVICRIFQKQPLGADKKTTYCHHNNNNNNYYYYNNNNPHGFEPYCLPPLLDISSSSAPFPVDPTPNFLLLNSSLFNPAKSTTTAPPYALQTTTTTATTTTTTAELDFSPTWPVADNYQICPQIQCHYNNLSSLITHLDDHPNCYTYLPNDGDDISTAQINSMLYT